MKKVRILSKRNNTHDVLQLKTEKPKGFDFIPGQAVDLALDHPKWKDDPHPFTFTSLPSDDYLEFHIKVYPERNGLTAAIDQVKEGDHFLLGEVFGAIQYKGEGLFIAGGAGVTPFISIIKDLEQKGEIGNNKLIFANKKETDIIEKSYFEKIFGDHFINVLSEAEQENYEKGFVDQSLLQKTVDDSTKYYYLCGPPPMMDGVLDDLKKMNIDQPKIITEDF